jgi:hypothetical protein
VREDIEKQPDLIVTVTLEDLVPRDHPIRHVKKGADEALRRLGPRVGELYSERGRKSVPPEVLPHGAGPDGRRPRRCGPRRPAQRGTSDCASQTSPIEARLFGIHVAIVRHALPTSRADPIRLRRLLSDVILQPSCHGWMEWSMRLTGFLGM